MKDFAIRAHIDGANDALEKGDIILANTSGIKISSLEENMQQSSVRAILLDKDDMTNKDYASRLFQNSVEIAQNVQISHGNEKAFIVIPTEQSVIPSHLCYLPRLLLGILFK
ncbi:hypothetical protein CHS0354_035492 [Potamilus streckersoni]|uniref:Uncharacterized protein n=1 Tax=Potamilus streckersoni TaxID=2493646 RepID=A0AAE0RVL8_9BIVA|nr:hypothetical protein CHS0354_035492 [Potamilus streckersoni]